MTVTVKFSIGGGDAREMRLPSWADHIGNGVLVAEKICEQLSANDNNNDDELPIVVKIFEPKIVAGIYSANLKYILRVYTARKVA